MRTTSEQRTARAAFRALVAPLRLRVMLDLEGWPIAPGRYGQIEWYCDGRDCHSCPLPGRFAVAIYSQTMRMLAKLTRIPGVRRHQIGDREFRLVLPVDTMHDRASLGAVAKLLRVRTRRLLSERSQMALDHGRKLFQRREATAP